MTTPLKIGGNLPIPLKDGISLKSEIKVVIKVKKENNNSGNVSFEKINLLKIFGVNHKRIIMKRKIIAGEATESDPTIMLTSGVLVMGRVAINRYQAICCTFEINLLFKLSAIFQEINSENQDTG